MSLVRDLYMYFVATNVFKMNLLQETKRERVHVNKAYRNSKLKNIDAISRTHITLFTDHLEFQEVCALNQSSKHFSTQRKEARLHAAVSKVHLQTSLD